MWRARSIWSRNRKRNALTRGETETTGYETGDVRAGYGLPNGVTIRVGVLNVWDENYVDHLNAKKSIYRHPDCGARPSAVCRCGLEPLIGAWSFLTWR